jgi:RHS repeat-associated protein
MRTVRPAILAALVALGLLGEPLLPPALGVQMKPMVPGSATTAAATSGPRQSSPPAPTQPKPLRVGEQPDRRTRTSVTRFNADHTFTTTAYAHSVNYREPRGEWRPIDSTLVPTQERGYAYENRANSFRTYFKQTLADDYLRLVVDGQTLNLSLSGRAAVGASVKGSSIQYAGALPGVTARYDVGPDSVEETLVLQDRSAPASFRFLLGAPAQLEVEPRQDGSWAFRAPGRLQPSFVLAAPLAYDSGPRSLSPKDTHARLDVQRVVGGFQIDLALDGAWLQDPARRFPVFLDPTLTVQPDSNDASFAANCGNCVPFVDTGTGRMYIGTGDSNVWREAIRFDTSAIPAGVTVSSASVGIYYDGWCISATGPFCGGISHRIDAHRMTAAWSTSTVTSQIQFDPAILSSYTLPSGASNRWMSWDVSSAVNGWVSGTLANYGLYMMLSSEPLSASGPTPPGMRYPGDISLTPSLTVTFTGDAVAVSQPTVLHANGAELSWSPYTGASGAPFQHYQVHRSPTPGFTPSSSTLLTSISDVAVTSYRDTTAAANATFYYAVVANSSKSNEVRASLPADGQASMLLQPAPGDGKATFISYYTSLVNCANYGAGQGLWAGTDTGVIHRSLLQFDLRQIPLGATNISAQLSLWHLYQNSVAMTLHAYRATTSWQEGTGPDSTAVCTGDGATWYETTGGVSWKTQGGDFDAATASSQVSIAANEAPQWDTFDVSGAVGQWQSGQKPNLGLIVKSDNESLVAGNATVFASDDYSSAASLRPKLQVTYADGSHAVAPTVSVSSPGPGAVVSGRSVTLTAAATDDRFVRQVQFTVDGSPAGTTSAVPWSVSWDSTTAANGSHTITATATDDAGNAASSSQAVTVANFTPPTVSLTAPAPNSTVSGPVTVSANASAAAGLSRVELYVDDIRLTTLTSAPYSFSWNTLDGTVYDGSHSLTARAYDVYGQVTTSTAVAVTLANTASTQYRAAFGVNAVPQAVVYDPGATNQYSIKVTVTNNSTVTWPSSTYLRYRWVSVASTSSPSVDGPASAVVALAKNKSTTVTMTVPSPALGAGVAQAQYQLWFDVWDASANVWFSARGNPPLVNSVTVNLALKTALGLEKYYQYTQDPVGAGMTHMVNVANGNSILTWTPFDLPGRGLATAVRLTYNSLEEHSDSVAGANWSLSVSSLTRFGQPLDIHPNNNDTNTSNRWIGLVDGDGTFHRFQGNTDASGNVYYVEPPGVHLYLRQYSTTDTSRWWAFTRPDRVTFFYNQAGFPTFVTDRNGNTLTFTVSPIQPSDDPGNLRFHVTAVTDAGGRTVNIAYYTHADAPRPRVRGLVKSITDHDKSPGVRGHELDFVYNDDGNLARIVQQGGSNADGSFLADRGWQFAYTTPDGSGPATNLNAESTKLYAVTDPRGGQTRFAYITSGQDKWKLASYTDRATDQTTLGYDDANLVTTVTEPLSRITRYGYANTGQVTSIARQLDASTTLTTGLQWSPDLAVTRLTEPNGAASQFGLDANGYQTDRIDQVGDHLELRYQGIAIDSGDQGIHWCPSTGVVNGSVCAPRTIPHISQLQTRTDPNGVAAGSGFQWSFGYDPKGNLTQVTDPLQHPSTNGYNADGTLAQTTDANTNVTRYTSYDANGLATTVVDGIGNTMRVSHDADGLLLSIQDADHQTGCATCSDPSQFQTIYRYDSFNRLGATSQPKSTTLAQGTLIWSDTFYDPNDNVTTRMAPYYASGDIHAGDATQVTYDAMDRPTLTTDPDRSADPAGERTAYRYDAAGRVTQVVLPVGSQNGVQVGAASSPHTVNYTYDALDRKLSQTTYHVDAGGVLRTLTTLSCYDSADNLVSATQPNAGLSSIVCPGTSSTPNTTLYAYDAAHRPRSTTDADGHTTSYDYDFDSNRIKVTDPNNNPISYGFDQLNRMVSVDRPYVPGHHVIALLEYDAVGNKSRVISPRAYDASADKQTFSSYVTAYHYDADNRLVRTDLPVDTANPTQYYVLQSYDPNGLQTAISRPVTTTDPTQLGQSQQTTMRHFDTGWIATSQDPGASVVHFDYSAKGEQLLRAPENAQGVLDRSKEMDWDYFPDGQVHDRFDPQHQPITYSYNADDVLASTHNAGGITDPSQSFIDSRNTLDDLDRVIRTDQKKATDSNWTFASYGYDSNSNLTDQVLNGQESAPNGTLVKAGRTIHVDYDQANWLTDQYDYGTGTAAAPAANAQRVLERFTPSGKELRREVDKNNGTGGWALQQLTTWDYYANDLLNHMTTTNASGATLEAHTVSYLDPGGVFDDGFRTQDVYSQQQPSNTTQACSPSCTATYSYDPRDRLISENNGHGTRTTYTVDGGGNVLTEAENGTTTKTYTYNGDQIATLTSGGRTLAYHYDTLGRLWCITTTAGSIADCGPSANSTSSSNLVTDYEYDYLDRLRSYRAFSSGTVTDTSTYVYDALDRQVSETESHPGLTAPRTTQSTYLGLSKQLTQEQVSSNNTTTEVKDYTYDPYGNRLTFTDTPYSNGSPSTPTTYSYGYNVHDSVSQLVDPAGGVKASYGYKPYGSPDASTTQGDTNQNSPLNPFRYEAKRFDSGSKSYDTGARQYAPDTSHFLTADVFHGALANLGLSSDLLTQDRYGLAGGNPLSFIEWDGHMLLADGGGGGAVSPAPSSYSSDSGSSGGGSESSQPNNSDSGGNVFERAWNWGKKQLHDHADDLQSVAKGAEKVAGVAGTIAAGCAIVGAVASETVVGGIAGGACASVAGAVAVGASGVALVANAGAKAGGAHVSNLDLALDAVGAVPGVGAVARGARAARGIQDAARIGEGVTSASRAAEGGQVGRVFWSGGATAKNAASAWARANNAVTLDMTAEGRAVEAATSKMEWSDARPLWESASRQFAQEASGDVHVFQNAAGVSINSIWAQIEYRALKENPNVTNIIYHVVGGE